MVEQNILREIRLRFPARTEIRYAFGETGIYELMMSLNPNGYCSHYTAMALHGLTEQRPTTYYLNIEQTPKPRPESALEQDRIDAVFRRPPRVSGNLAVYEDSRICLLSGQHTGNLGVTTVSGPNGETIRTTSIERTLIDITVRPWYAGGVYEVLKAFRAARDVVSVARLVAFLRQLNYIYPYHQALGFYMDTAGGFKEKGIQTLSSIPMQYDFYLDHGIKGAAYSKRWRLYFPQGL